MNLNIKKIYIASDHAGFKVKEKMKKYLKAKGLVFEDMGTHSSSPTDYPDYAFEVAKKVASQKGSRGILICGTGTGMVMAANKVKGVRAVAAYDKYSAQMSRRDNDANVLCLRGRFFPFEKIKDLVSIWLAAPFSGQARHKKRIRKLSLFEKKWK
jgi:ribose 5-phosphate isomerase B